jgi:hypothetical protein
MSDFCWFGIVATLTPTINARDGFGAQTLRAGERFVDDGFAGVAVVLLDLGRLVVADIFAMVSHHKRTTRRS